MTMPNKTRIFRFKGRELKLNGNPHLVGIVNVTPDSFSDGGLFFHPDAAVQQALRLLSEGAQIIDVGGESTRPGSIPVEPDEEIRRVVPVVRELRQASPGVIISVDTRNPETALAVMKAGGDIINDISGLAQPDMSKVAAATGAGLVLMHMRGTPQTMQNPENLIYQNVVSDVCEFLRNSVQKALDNGVKRENIVLDPGIGFAKDLNGNHRLLHEIRELQKLDFPVLVGHCRKKFIGQVLQIDEPKQRIYGSIGVAVWLAACQVDFIRVHEVKAVREAIEMFLWCSRYNVEE